MADRSLLGNGSGSGDREAPYGEGGQGGGILLRRDRILSPSASVMASVTWGATTPIREMSQEAGENPEDIRSKALRGISCQDWRRHSENS